ncbi:hypothetical protein FB45DRAFT_519463 [Roridomyces roridus]|uniref:Uncharacterized protein n=1 Tax=Roridomyces roridus TaxID=1738132 RepID=A0AAD7BXD0_9AGAR|nr:hypothetical protein FB45DRAFT_519463 [Roridomyces roridus]
MARSPTKATKRQPARQRAPSLKTQDDFDAIQDDEDGEMDVDDSDDSADILNKFLAEYKKREAKKATARSAAFQSQKKALYASARNSANDLAREGTAALEAGKAMLFALKAQETSAEQFSNRIVPQWDGIAHSTKALLSLHSTGFEELYPRRSNEVDNAVQMLTTNPITRREALERREEEANAQLHQNMIDQTVRLILRYGTSLTARTESCRSDRVP